MAWMSQFQMLGLLLGPAIPAALSPFGHKDISETSELIIDMITINGYAFPFGLENILQQQLL